MVCNAPNTQSKPAPPTCYVVYHVDLVLSQIGIPLSEPPDASGIRWIYSPEPIRCVAARAYAAKLHLAMLIEMAIKRGWPISETNGEAVFAIFGMSLGEADTLFRSWGCAPGTYTVKDLVNLKDSDAVESDQPPADPLPPMGPSPSAN